MSKDVGIEGTRPLTTRVAEGRGDKQFCDANKIFGVRHFAGNVRIIVEFGLFRIFFPLNFVAEGCSAGRGIGGLAPEGGLDSSALPLAAR